MIRLAIMAAISLPLAAQARDLILDPEVQQLRADLADDLWKLEVGLGGMRLVRPGQEVDPGFFFGALEDAVQPSEGGVRAARSARSLIIGSVLFLGGGAALTVVGPLVAGTTGADEVGVAISLVGLAGMFASLVTTLLAQQSFLDAVNSYNDDLVRGKLDAIADEKETP